MGTNVVESIIQVCRREHNCSGTSLHEPEFLELVGFACGLGVQIEFITSCFGISTKKKKTSVKLLLVQRQDMQCCNSVDSSHGVQDALMEILQWMVRVFFLSLGVYSYSVLSENRSQWAKTYKLAYGTQVLD